MIFVTVGTHEQPFNRLVKAIDLLKRDGKIKDNVFIQIGYSTYVPQYCNYKHFISPECMDKLMDDADIIVTHGGPSSFISALRHSKVPIVVPRLKRYGEHINNHQLSFCKELKKRNFPMILIENDDDLRSAITKGREDGQHFSSNNAHFNERLIHLINQMFEK